MGELILCNQTIAAMPYYLENASLNVYSMEEICYYIENELYLLDADFMDEELCIWFERELGLKKLSERLRQVIYQGGTLLEFVEPILAECGYCSEASVKHILKVVEEMQNKSAFECGKIRADRFMENKKYDNAAMEYRRLLAMEEECKKQPVLTGNIWHNLGVSYAGLFLFEEAAECFLGAYALNQNQESLNEALAAFRCKKDAAGGEQVRKAYGISEEEYRTLSEGWTKSSRATEITEFEQQLDALFAQGQELLTADGEILSVIEEWKRDYKKINKT